MITNTELESGIREALNWNPEVDARHVAVSVSDGAVTLSGYVSSSLAKTRAIGTTERVYGVKAVADELEVRLPKPYTKDDSAIAESIAHILGWNVDLAKYNVQAKVANSQVTLTGVVDWNFEREEAHRSVASVVGVTHVLNRITLRPRTTAAQVQKQVTNALARHAALDARQIHVSVSENKALLSGHAHSVDEARTAVNAVWSAPGITQVENHIHIEP